MKEVLSNKKKSEVLAEKIKELKYGDIILHKQIAKVIKEHYPSSKYTTILSKTRKLLLEEGICLENIVGDGYRLVMPDNFIDHSLKHYKRGFHEMQKGYDTLAHAPTKNMTLEGRNTYRRVYDRAITLAATMQGVSVELKTLSRKQHPMAVKNMSK